VVERAPVLLVPGWSNRGRHLRHLARYLRENGWREDAVTTVDFRDPFGSNLEHATEIARAVHALRDRTGSDNIDVVAHSMGGLATRCYLAGLETRGCPLRRVVFLATPHAGTWAALFAFGGGRREMLPGSDLLNALACQDWPDGLETFSVRTPWDMRVLPRSSACLPTGREIVLPRVTHQGLLRNRRAHLTVRAILEAPPHT
jgi:triacylglycerol lipase